MASSSSSESKSAVVPTNNNSYKIFRRLPPFYTLQPNLQSQSKQISCWGDFILDLAVAVFHQTGAIGIQVTPHSPLFKSPSEVNRALTSKGARSVLRALMENQGGYRCLPLSLEDDDGGNNDDENVENDITNNNNKEDDDEFDVMSNDGDENSSNTKMQQQQQQHSSIFSNCDALVVLALPCEKIVQAIWSWHDELQTSSVFSVNEIAEDSDIKKRIAKLLTINRDGGGERDDAKNGDVGLMILGESISCDDINGHQHQQKKNTSTVHVSPLSYATVIETIMTTEHPAMAHLKRPTLISGSGGSLGLKF